MARSRLKMKLTLTEQEFEKLWSSRNISEGDIPSLGMLMLESYRGTIDYEEETIEDAIEEIRSTIKGQYGPFLRDCSLVIEEKGQIAAASLVVWSEAMKLPLLAYSMTDPDFKNQGMGTFLLKKSINALLAQGYKELCLVVTEGNVPAQRLYEKIGFWVFD